MRKFLTLAVLGLAFVGCAETEVKQEADSGISKEACSEKYDGAGSLDGDGDCIDGLPNSDASQDEAEDASEDVEDAPPELARVGDSITLEAGPDRIKATLVSVTDPIEPYVDPYLGEAFDKASPGNRLFGVTLKVKNMGTNSFDPSYAGTGSLVMRNDNPASDATLVDTKPWSDYTSAKVAPSSSLNLSFPYEAPTGQKPGRFQYSVSGDTLDEVTGEWTLR